MRGVVMIGGVLALMSAPAAAAQISNFQVAGWRGGAYTNQAGNQFNHCGASATYNSGIIVSFAVSRTYQWSMAFSHGSWRLAPGQSYNIAFTVDHAAPLSARAIAIGTNQVEVVLADSTQLFQQFRQGQQLRVAAAGQVFTFNLTGTSQLLPTLMQCVRANLNPQPATAPAVAANPFSAPAAAPSSTESKGRPPAYRAEAVSLAANILGGARVTGFRIVDADVNTAYDAAWVADSMFGMIRIEPSDKPELMSATTIALDAASCKSKFVSGSMPAERSGEGPRLFTKCGEGNDAMSVFYFIMPRKAGGHYLIGTGSFGSEEPARQAESEIRNAVITGR